jgi:hypothetical protein
MSEIGKKKKKKKKKNGNSTAKGMKWQMVEFFFISFILK